MGWAGGAGCGFPRQLFIHWFRVTPASLCSQTLPHGSSRQLWLPCPEVRPGMRTYRVTGGSSRVSAVAATSRARVISSQAPPARSGLCWLPRFLRENLMNAFPPQRGLLPLFVFSH